MPNLRSIVRAESAAPPAHNDLRRVILASTLGSVFEWYDFYIYGTLAGLFGKLFFPIANAGAGFLLALATFGIGFAVRPLGAVVFGILGDRLGRKYTFIVTIALMGVATAAIGLLPTFDAIGVLAPVLLVLFRALQGFAIGGEYGGAAIYVAEHAPAGRRGFLTAFIQAGVPAGLVLSLTVTTCIVNLIGEEAWEAWGWRLPFLLSLVLLAISLWIRLKLAESPVFKAMSESGRASRQPLRDSLDSWPKIKRLLIALAVTCGQAVGAYMALFQAMYFLQSSLHVRANVAHLIAIIATIVGMLSYFLFGALSDRLGRKKLIVAGFALTIALLFPLFHFIAAQGNPTLSAAMIRSPVVVTGTQCHYEPFATKGQPTECGRLLDTLAKNGVAYSKVDGGSATTPSVSIGGVAIEAADPSALIAKLKLAGYNLDTVTPPLKQATLITLAVMLVYILAAMVYGPFAALLVELFPSRVRYTSLSIPYHLGNGYAGGFLPFISQYIVVKTGDPFSGLWYPVSVVTIALIVTVLFLPETAGRDLE